MPPRKKKKKKKKTKKAKILFYLLYFLIMFLVAAFFSYRAFSEEHAGKPPENSNEQNSLQAKAVDPVDVRKPHLEELTDRVKQKDSLPIVAIVMDDLGVNKKSILPLLEMNNALTLSILPHERYSKWIAEEAHSRGFEVIAHIPMEAKEGNKLGKGGLYTWMSEYAVREMFKYNLAALPHIKGISNHMGSLFTQDEYAMGVLVGVLKEQRLYFLDSVTASGSAGYSVAQANGLKSFKRDIFLDNGDNPVYIEAQWHKLVERAREKGYAVGIGHPRKNTIEFLGNILKKNEVKVVPLSKIADIP
jgi:polysaccharide deacetylase 2 family uncharacterized protein YibQ